MFLSRFESIFQECRNFFHTHESYQKIALHKKSSKSMVEKAASIYQKSCSSCKNLIGVSKVKATYSPGYGLRSLSMKF